MVCVSKGLGQGIIRTLEGDVEIVWLYGFFRYVGRLVAAVLSHTFKDPLCGRHIIHRRGRLRPLGGKELLLDLQWDRDIFGQELEGENLVS
jgi:hypothetical protein